MKDGLDRPTMRHLKCFCLMLLFLIQGGLADLVAAEPSQERITLSFSGADCSLQRRSIEAALAQVSGVNHVDLDSVPDHALIDVAEAAVTTDMLIAAARRNLVAGIQCRVEVMKSCISANFLTGDR